MNAIEKNLAPVSPVSDRYIKSLDSWWVMWGSPVRRVLRLTAAPGDRLSALSGS